MLLTGIMGLEELFNKGIGKLYSLSPKTGLVQRLENIWIPGGLAWTNDQTKMFQIDSGKNIIESFDFDKTSLLSAGKFI